VIFYPSFGNKNYPYTGWRYKNKFAAWDTLEIVAKKYHAMYRAFRNKYKWPPQIVDELDINRILRIFNELVEDAEKQNDSIDEDDLE